MCTLVHELVAQAVESSVSYGVVAHHWAAARETARVLLADGTQSNLPLGVVGRSTLAAGRCGPLVVNGRDLGLDASPIGSGAHLGEDRTNGLHQTKLVAGRGKLEGSLDNVVGIVVSEKTLHLARLQQLIHNHVLGGG